MVSVSSSILTIRQFPRVKVGKRYLIPIKALDDFLNSRIEYGPKPVKPRKKPPPKKKR
jgi:hypothetical protein